MWKILADASRFDLLLVHCRRLRLEADDANKAAKMAAEEVERDFQDRLSSASSDSEKVHVVNSGDLFVPIYHLIKVPFISLLPASMQQT